MRVYDLKGFLELPAGTLYCKGKPWAFGELQVKEETLGRDWVCLHLDGIDASDSGELFWRYEQMLADGASYPLNDGYGRDGCFDDDALFLVFEEADLLTLRAIVDRALTARNATGT